MWVPHGRKIEQPHMWPLFEVTVADAVVPSRSHKNFGFLKVPNAWNLEMNFELLRTEFENCDSDTVRLGLKFFSFFFFISGS